MNCPNCQQTLESNARFCITCGLIFIGEASRTHANATTAPATTVVKADPQTDPQTDRMLGRTLDGKYELLARLGQGGMGTVYRARRVHIGDEVAVKMLKQNYVTEADAIARFRREAQAAASLHHPNVVTIYDYSETRDDAAAYIVMELVPGVSLGQLLQGGNRLPLARAVALMHSICAGVGAAHRRQIVHRDLKPDNIIVVPPSTDNVTETVKVVDFGIAKLRDLAATHALTEAGMMIGTPFYMSPEQCRGEALDARSDVYSLGVMFYEMIAGMRPFTAPTPTGVIAKQLMAAPPPLHSTLKIPHSVEAVLLRALAKDPNARPADATAFALALVQAITNAQQSVPAVPHVSVPTIGKAPAHTGRKALVAIVVLICLLAGANTMFARRRSQAPSTQTVRQQEQPIASPTPGRSNQLPRPKSVAVSKAATIETRTPLAKAQPSVTVVHDSPRAARTTPPRTPLGAYRGKGMTKKDSQEFFISVPASEHAPVIRASRRAQPRETTEQMPPEVQQVFKQLMKQPLTPSQPNGKVTTVYVTRQGN